MLSSTSATDDCPCGRMVKSTALWCCRLCYLQKELNYAIFDLEREDDQPRWTISAMRRLYKLRDLR